MKFSTHSRLYGDPEAGWYHWYLYYLEVLNIDFSKIDQTKMKAWWDFTQNCHWIFPYANICILVDSPVHITLEEGRIHNEKEMAVRYSDGWGIYAIDGVTVPAKVVLAPQELTVKEIDEAKIGEPSLSNPLGGGNAEVRRIMIERYGPGRYMLESGANCIDYSAGLGLKGSAPRALYKTKDGSNWLAGTDGSTRRLYWMPIPSEAKTCSEAHRMISGLDNENRLLAEC